MAGRFRWCNGIGGLSVGWARGTDDREADMHEASSRLQRVSRRARSSSSSWFSPSCCYCYVVAVAVLLLQWNALRGEALHPPPAPPTRFFSRPPPPTSYPPPAPRPPPHVCSLVTSLSSSSSSSCFFFCCCRCNGKHSYSDDIGEGYCRCALSCTLVALSQHGRNAGKALTEGRPRYTAGIVGAPYHPPLWRCHSTEAKQAAMTCQLMAIVLRTHGQRAAEQRPRIAAARGVSDTVSHWHTRTARNHSRARLREGIGLLWARQRGKAMTEVSRYCRWALYPPLWRCHSTDAKQAKCNRGAPYIYWGYSRWAVASTIVALSQHGSKAGSNDMPVNGKSFAHAGPESTKTAAEDCRCEGCIRHRLTLAHQDRPKPQQGQVA